MVMITSGKSGNKDEFWKYSFMLGYLKSPINIHKFNLCIPISLGVHLC